MNGERRKLCDEEMVDKRKEKKKGGGDNGNVTKTRCGVKFGHETSYKKVDDNEYESRCKWKDVDEGTGKKK